MEFFQRVQQPSRWERLEWVDLVRRLTDYLQALAEASRSQYRVVFRSQDWTLDSHLVLFQGCTDEPVLWPLDLLSVLRDLVGNSRKYSPPGSLIRVSLTEGPTDWLFEVSDTGRGIPDHDLPLVVVPGYRATNVQTSDATAGGHGLPRALRLAQDWGGSLSLASRLGQGTTVRLKVPKRPIEPENFLDKSEIDSKLQLYGVK